VLDFAYLSTPGQNYGDVAQIFNLLYRRFAIGCATENPRPGAFGRMTECNSAIQQIKNLRYDTSSYLCPLALSLIYLVWTRKLELFQNPLLKDSRCAVIHAWQQVNLQRQHRFGTIDQVRSSSTEFGTFTLKLPLPISGQKGLKTTPLSRSQVKTTC